MRKIRPCIALMVAAFLWTQTIGPARAAQVRSVQFFGSWQGGEFTSDQTHKFDHCGAWASYKSGITLHVSVDRQYGWILGFQSAAWSLTPGATLSLVMTFDGAAPWTGTGRAAQPQFAVIPMVPDSTLVGLFRRARLMTIDVGNQRFNFALDGTSRLMVTLSQCVATALAIERGDPPPNFASASSPAPARSVTPSLIPPAQDSRTADLERAMAATRIASNLLLQAKFPNARLLSDADTPGELKGRGAAWISDMGIGAVELLPASSGENPQSVSSSMLGGDAAQCKGDFASSRSSELVDGKIVTKANSLCTDSRGLHAIKYFILQADPAGYVVYAVSVPNGASASGAAPAPIEDSHFQSAAVNAAFAPK